MSLAARHTIPWIVRAGRSELQASAKGSDAVHASGEIPVDRDSQRIGAALAEFYRVNDYGEDGGVSARWVRVTLKPLPLSLYIPNFDARRHALRLHDIHHLVTGYKTNLAGEAEIAAWEIGGSCTTYWAAWLLNFTAFCYGWLCLPRRVFRAFVRGRRTRNLYHEGWRDAFLDETIGRMRRRLELVQTTPRARLSDIGLYLVWVMMAIVSTVGIGATIGGLLVGVARLLAN